jgi:plasmid stability protein
MAVNLSIKNAPEDVVQRLRARAERHHRSLQGELMAIIEAAVREERPTSPAAILAEVRRLGLSTPAEAAAIVRADRDAR